MPQLFSFTHLSDGKRLYLANPHIGDKSGDSEGFQYYDAYEDEYLEEKVGLLGFKMSGTVYGVWDFSQYGDAREQLAKIMRLALPLLALPLSSADYDEFWKVGRYPMIGLFSEGTLSYNKETHVVHVPAGNSPEDFFKSTIFGGKLDDDALRRVALTHAYIAGASDEDGDFVFDSFSIAKDLWPIKPEKAVRTYRGLLEDGLLQGAGPRELSNNLPIATRIPLDTRRMLDGIEIAREQSGEEQPVTATELYIPDGLTNQIVNKSEGNGYDTTKLQQIISELNDSYDRRNALSAHTMTRALLDHISPLFNQPNFNAVANNHAWPTSTKKRVKELNTIIRSDADDGLHSQISSRDASLTLHSIGVVRTTVHEILKEAAEL